MAASPAQLLQAALRGAPERPLVVPLASAVAGELQDLQPQVVLADAGKLSMLVKEVAVSLGADAAVAEFGTFWDAEALGMTLDWSAGFPPTPRGTLGALDLGRPRAAVVLETVRRLRALVDLPVAAGITGPAALARLSGAEVEAVAPWSLAAARALCEAGARILWVVEGPEPPPDPAAYVAAAAPLWGSVRFYNALGVLHVAGAADGWLPVVERGGPLVPCFDPDGAPALAGVSRSFGLALPPGPPSARAGELAAGDGCVLVTHTRELAGAVASREIAGCAAELRAVAA